MMKMEKRRVIMISKYPDCQPYKVGDIFTDMGNDVWSIESKGKTIKKPLDYPANFREVLPNEQINNLNNN